MEMIIAYFHLFSNCFTLRCPIDSQSRYPQQSNPLDRDKVQELSRTSEKSDFFSKAMRQLVQFERKIVDSM